MEDGSEVAVKLLMRERQNGDREFIAEVEMLIQLHHRNLIKLIGICIEEWAHCLVYELVRNESVESHLHDEDREGESEGSRTDSDGDGGTEQEFNAKLSVFGLAKAGPTGDRTHVSTKVVGTYGYAAPEYIATGRLSAKSDVYCFGVVLLELLTGRRALDKSKIGIEQRLVDWVKPYLSDKRASSPQQTEVPNGLKFAN